MGIQSRAKQGVWDPDRADEIEADLESMTDLIGELQEIRDGISNSSWVCHERIAALQMKIFDRRITHMMALQGIAPEKNSLAALTKKDIQSKLDQYTEQLAEMKKRYA